MGFLYCSPLLESVVVTYKEKKKLKKGTLCLWLKTERMTEMRSVSVVKCSKPRIPLSCCRQTTIAAPAMKPSIVACERKSMIKPSLQQTPHKKD